jgi:hypothetical protein
LRIKFSHFNDSVTVFGDDTQGDLGLQIDGLELLPVLLFSEEGEKSFLDLGLRSSVFLSGRDTLIDDRWRCA